ncbi:hypothetical protein AAG747_28700 [Rapidithrix thailandica]|uniref:Type VI secretion, VasB, ImpH, VC_A0111 n=1 Tax=Rapidithrix thailandica TaxID=413964 RepID=A0AAW9SLA7_9BACT
MNEHNGIDMFELVDKINSFHFDIKVEVLLAAIISNHSWLEHKFLVSHKGQFVRAFRREILSSQITDFNFETDQYVLLNVSKDSIYDMLPEGIFHYPKNDKIGRDVSEMTDEYRKQKKEEAEARKFFMPFENEFLLHAIHRESLENELLYAINGSRPLDFFYHFWELDTNLPPLLVAKMIKLLPYIHKISGNLQLTAQCLSYILDEEVVYEEIGYRELSESEQNSIVGDIALGLDMILGGSYMDYSLYVEFKIGAIKGGNAWSYFHQGQTKKFIELFYEYFLPLEVDAKTTVILLEEEEQFFVSQPNTMLGITTRI